MFLINSIWLLSIVTSELSNAADSASETDDNEQAVMTLIQATILQIMIEKNSASVFNNEWESVAVTNMNTEMITETTDFLSKRSIVMNLLALKNHMILA